MPTNVRQNLTLSVRGRIRTHMTDLPPSAVLRLLNMAQAMRENNRLLQEASESIRALTARIEAENEQS